MGERSISSWAREVYLLKSQPFLLDIRQKESPLQQIGAARSIFFIHKKKGYTMEVNNKYIRFDWAVKRMLRDKANFAVLEGLITVLLNEKITISEILESEGNQENARDKFNRVDIMAKNSKGEIIIVEV